MRRFPLLALCIGCATAPPPSPAPVAVKAPPPAVPAPAWRYPPAPPGDVVGDAYRWLEALDSPQTQAWVAAENQLTDSFFAQAPAVHEAFRARLGQLEGYETFGLPFHRGSRFFWTHNDGKQGQQVLLTAARLEDPPAVLVDPNVLSADGKLAFAGTVVSIDGARVAYGLSNAGGDWTTWHVREIGQGTQPPADAPDTMEFTKYYAPSFTHDGKSLYYSRFPAPAPGKELSETDHDCRIYLHRLGAPANKDAVVFERPDHPSWQFEPHVSRDGRYLIIEVGDGEVGDRGQEQVYFLDLSKPGAKPIALIDAFEAEFIVIGNQGPIFFVQTNLDAPTRRIVAIDTRAPARSHWKEIVPAAKEALESASLIGKQLIVTRLRDAQSAVTAYDLTGKALREVALPGIGSAYGFSGGPTDAETYYYFTSFTAPGSIYRYDLLTGASTLWKSPTLPFDASQFETRQVFYPGKDGTRIPMFITAKKGTPLDGKNPTLLTGYGGFNISLTPAFNPTDIAWIERGGVVAQANIRGGGEYGEAWHQAGMRAHKQVVFDDFIAAGEWLVANQYTSPKRLGVIGASNGGLLIGAVVTQRPDLFGAAAPLSGVLDMLRFHLFGQGAGWAGDYGSPDDPEDFKVLRAYSPVHNVRPGERYPAILVVTADHDVRVAPLHSYKFAAALQAAQAGPAPVLLRVETTSGHGGGTTRNSRVNQAAELLTFFAQSLGAGHGTR